MISSFLTLTHHPENTVITLSDWYHLQSPSITGVAANDATLFNGQGRYPGGPQVDLAVINVVQGKRYRFRIIAMSCDPNYIFSIDGHELTIIEADGQSTEPLPVDQIQIFAGQRYSFVVCILLCPLIMSSGVSELTIGNSSRRTRPSTTTGFAHSLTSAPA